MGMDIDGCVEDFNQRLEMKGFSFIDSFETSYSFWGKFANEIVTLTVLATPISKIVCKVIVFFPDKENWEDLKKDYFFKKKMFKSKYVLESDFEFFMSPYEEGDGYEIRAVSKEKCNYKSFFSTLGGNIMVEIDKTKRIKVVYEDKINMEKGKTELNKMALDDI